MKAEDDGPTTMTELFSKIFTIFLLVCMLVVEPEQEPKLIKSKDILGYFLGYLLFRGFALFGLLLYAYLDIDNLRKKWKAGYEEKEEKEEKDSDLENGLENRP
jgi:hypothetical protein